MFAGLSGIFRRFLLLIGGPMIDFEYHNFLLCIVSFWVDKCTVRVLSFLFEGVACTVKVSPNFRLGMLLVLSKYHLSCIRMLFVLSKY